MNRLRPMRIAGGALVIWWVVAGEAAVDPVATAAKFLGIPRDKLVVVQGPRPVEISSRQKFVEVVVTYDEPDGAGKARARVRIDPRTSVVAYVFWADPSPQTGPPERSLPVAKLQAIATAFARAHNPLPGTEMRLERARPWMAPRQYAFEWALVRDGDPFPSGRIGVAVRCANGKLASYFYLPLDTNALRQAKMTREQALQIATREAPRLTGGKQLQLRDAVLLDRSPYTSEGRPTWCVTYRVLLPHRDETLRRAGFPWSIYIDAIDGRVLYKDR